MGGEDRTSCRDGGVMALHLNTKVLVDRPAEEV